jgi:glycosyltransferase involved in cell wall biosynthesis
VKIIIGVSTYGPIPRVNGFIRSLWNNLEDWDHSHEIIRVCADDGTTNIEAITERREFCKRNGFQHVLHMKNFGVPFTLNRLAEYEDADLAILFDDDIRFTGSGWFSRLLYFFEQNPDVGMVGLPLINTSGFRDADPRWSSAPLRVLTPSCSAFAIQPKRLRSIENVDGSRGFWVDLISHYEDVAMGLQLATTFTPSYVLPWPPVHHLGAATFKQHPELGWREGSEYVDHEAYLEYVRNIRWYNFSHEEMYAKNMYERLSFARYMLCKYYGVFSGPRLRESPRAGNGMIDAWETPERLIQEEVIDMIPPRQVKWLDRFGAGQVAWDKEDGNGSQGTDATDGPAATISHR